VKPFIFNSEQIEQMAAEIHSIYVEHAKANHLPLEYSMNYIELPEANKEFNRAFVRNIPKSVERMGYSIVPIGNKKSIKQFQPNEIESFAEMEHERWSKEKLDNGWQFGKIKDADHKLHPCLIPWSGLPEDEREKDRILVLRIPQILASVGYGVIRVNL
jgi:RyR domain